MEQSSQPDQPDIVPANQAAAPVQAEQPAAVGRKGAEERKELLARTLQGQIASGARIESQSDFQAVLVKGKPVNHTLHLILTLVTVGAWGLFVWLPLGIFGGEKRSMVTVDDYGNAAVQKI